MKNSSENCEIALKIPIYAYVSIRKKGEIERAEEIFKEIMAEKFPNLLKNINLHIQVAQQIPSKINTMRLTNRHLGTSLVVQWLRLRAPNAGGPGSIPGQGTRSRMLQLRAHMLQLKDPTCRN